MDEILKNHNSTVNQQIKDKLIDREINAVMTTEINSLLMASDLTGDYESFPSWNEIENYWNTPEYNGKFVHYNGTDDKEETLDNYRERLEQWEVLEDIYRDAFYCEDDSIMEVNYLNIEKKREHFRNEIEDLENLEIEPAEIMQWYNVSKWYYEKLKEHGEAVLEYGCGYYWGRQAYGQAVSLDFITAKIAYEMGILEGQEWSWANAVN